MRVLNMFGGFVPAFQFKALGVSLQNSYRLRGGGYRVYSTLKAPKRSQRRWLRHWLLAHSPSGIRPVPLKIWFTLPEMGSVDYYRLGVVREFVIRRLQPRDFNLDEIESLRLAYDGDDELFESLFQEWMKEYLEYLRWYATVYLDYNTPCEELLKPPMFCGSPRRQAYERNLYVRYGLLFQAWERYRDDPPLALTPLSEERQPEAESLQSSVLDSPDSVPLSALFREESER
jgi:hypothetical protein